MMLRSLPGHTTVAMLDVARQVAAYTQATAAWHTNEHAQPHDGDTAMLLHRANFDLWHLEDQARDPKATDAAVAAVKHRIDTVNQQRNDLVEQYDLLLLQHFAHAGLPSAAAPLHSETPGMMLDRLSILALKLFHTAEQANRTDATAAHRNRNRDRLHVLQQQSDDLACCLHTLLDEVGSGRRGYRLYRQLKMYNDPELNPVLYNSRGKAV